MTVVAEVTVKSEEASLPKSTAVAPVKPEPEMWMVSPPPAVPLDGVMAMIVTGLIAPLPEPPLPELPELPVEAEGGVATVSTDGGGVAAGPVAGEP